VTLHVDQANYLYANSASVGFRVSFSSLFCAQDRLLFSMCVCVCLLPYTLLNDYVGNY